MRDKSNYKHYENVSITPEMLMFPFEAESTAFLVCSYLGIDTSDYSFGYVAGWSSSRKVEELKSSMELIQKTANDFIDKIEAALTEQPVKAAV